MKQESAHNSIWQTSDVMIIITLVVGVILEYFVVDLGSIPFSLSFRLGLGGLFIFAGLVIMFLAKKEFNKKGQPSSPGKPITNIVNTGIYKYSRNPLYVGNIAAMVGIGITFNILWFVKLVIPLSVAIHWILIVPEEHYLLKKFGEDYEQYLKKVRRWL